MRASRFPLFTSKDTPADAEIISHQLMLRAGLIEKLGAGLYTWQPLGLRVLRRVEQVVREEMNRIGALEVLMPAVQPAELWQESGRWSLYGAELLRMQDRHERDFCFGPTHEEVITDYARREIRSYRQLPLTFYQIQTKFRDEIRPRFGVMRAREFVMKDAYSFHLDQASLQGTYNDMHAAYSRIFKRLGLRFRAVGADSGAIGGSVSEEFMVLADSGEDEILSCSHCDYAANTEVGEGRSAGDACPQCNEGRIEIHRGIEVGHIFQLGTKYSEAMEARVLDESGEQQPLIMGCYGIGVSRVVAAAIEQNHDEQGIMWPAPLAPFDVALVTIGADRSPAVAEAAESIYAQLRDAGVDVLWDDRNTRPGVKFADMELIGIPHRLVIGERGLAENNLEYRDRSASDNEHWPLDQLLPRLLERMGSPSSSSAG